MHKALGSPVRVRIIEMLNDGEMCFSDILEQVGGLKSTLSQNLSLMVDAGLLSVRKNSRCNYYKLTSAKVGRACRLMQEVLISNLKGQNNILLEIKETA